MSSWACAKTEKNGGSARSVKMIGEVRCINYCKKDVHVDITFIAYDACLVVHRYNVDDKL